MTVVPQTANPRARGYGCPHASLIFAVTCKASDNGFPSAERLSE